MRKECAISDASYQTSRTSSRSPSRYERITALPRARVTVGGLRHSHALRSALVTSVAGLAAVEGTHIAGAARPHHLREYGASVLVSSARKCAGWEAWSHERYRSRWSGTSLRR